MANICDTQIYIYSADKSIIQELHEKLINYIAVPACNVSKDNTRWLGNMLCHAGYRYDDVDNGKYGYTRGSIQYIDEIEDRSGYYSFFMDVEDCWGPNIEPFRHLITKLYPCYDIRIAWEAEEPGCEIFQKYDPDGLFFADDEYCVDCYVENPDAYNEYPELIDEHRPFSLAELQKIFKLESIDDIIARAEEIQDDMLEKYDSGFYHINKYEEMDSEY